MPHLTVRLPEAQLAGHELPLITALTDAVVSVYGAWARDLVVIHLDGVPPNRWAIGGHPVAATGPAITFHIREAALTRPDGPEVAARLAAALADAATSVLGDEFRSSTTIDLVGTPPGRTARDGVITD
jgi:phenylpyruvate tautomerase PptA (4-oxalocrotonate tautomerase family)